MVISCIELLPTPDKRQAMVEILQFVANGLRNNPACVACSVYEALDQDRTILYVEQWESEQGLHKHIRSSLYVPVLNAIDLAQTKPKVSFHEVGITRSLELVEALRTSEVRQ